MDSYSKSQAQQGKPGHILLSAVLLAALFVSLLGSFSFTHQGLAASAMAPEPGYVYQTIYNGGEFDSGRDEAVDDSGNAYILARVYEDATYNDVMVVKLSPAGSVLFTTYLRGSKNDYGTGLALDGQGGLLVSGWTDSADFPVVDAAQPVIDSRRSGFLARLSTVDGSLVYSSFFGASGADEFHDVVVGPTGDIYLAGVTDSTDFPTVNALQPNLTLTTCFCDDAVIVRLSPDARTVIYSSYLGGGRDDQASSLALDAAGNIYLAGTTQSDDFPTANPIQTNRSGSTDVWAARLSADGSHLDYSTYLGGANSESITRIAANDGGELTLAGTTNSSDFPTTANAYQPAFGGGLCGIAGFGQRPCNDAFIARLAPDGSGLSYSTYLGGANDDDARGVVVDSAGNAIVVGFFTSADTPPSEFDIYVASFDPTGSQLRYKVKLWSAVANDGHGIALGPDGDIYFTGAMNAPADLFAARLSESGGTAPSPTPTVTPTPTPTPTPSGGSLHVGDLDGGASGSRRWSAGVRITAHDAGHNSLANVTVSGAWSNGASGNDQCTTGADGTCTLTISRLRRNLSSVTFTVTDLAQSGSSYVPGDNHDPDGDSNGTSIVIAHP